MDAISTGATLAYITELYENGLITKEETNGLEMTWGNAAAEVAMVDVLGKREGKAGELFSDGVWAAWKKLGEKGTEFAIHIQGEELPAHDPKATPGLATTYFLTATPGRHTQGGELNGAPGLELAAVDKYDYASPLNAENHYKLVTTAEVTNTAGLCMFGYLSYPIAAIKDQLSAVTGWEYAEEDVYKTGERIYTMRHLFNLREGHNPLTRNIPARAVGVPPLETGNVKGITVDYKTMINVFLTKLDWDVHTTVPSDAKLKALGMDWAIAEKAKWAVPAV